MGTPFEYSNQGAFPARSASVLATLLIAVATVPALAQHPEPVGFRGGSTEAPGTVSQGARELEFGVSFERGDDMRMVHIGEMMLKLPLGIGSELRLAFNSWSHDRTTDAGGLEPAAIALAFDLPIAAGDNPVIPAAMIVAGAVLPTGSGEFAASLLEPEVTLALGWTPFGQWEAAAHASWAPEAKSYNGSVWISRPIAGPFAAYAEYTRELDCEGMLHGGIAFQLTDDLHLDAHSGRTMNGAERVFGLGFVGRW